jgi:outer membrane protein TolC
MVGEIPSRFSIAPSDEFRLDAPQIPPVLPSELLERRPDIARAERQMAAANASIGISRAVSYPRVTFSATGGFEDNSFNLFSIPNSLWSVGAGAVLPLFEGGLRHAELERSWSEMQLRTREIQASIALIRALGGGWRKRSAHRGADLALQAIREEWGALMDMLGPEIAANRSVCAYLMRIEVDAIVRI